MVQGEKPSAGKNVPSKGTKADQRMKGRGAKPGPKLGSKNKGTAATTKNTPVPPTPPFKAAKATAAGKKAMPPKPGKKK